MCENLIRMSKNEAPLAERGGFEPPVELTPYDSLANCWFKPLTHLSSFFFLQIKRKRPPFFVVILPFYVRWAK